MPAPIVISRRLWPLLLLVFVALLIAPTAIAEADPAPQSAPPSCSDQSFEVPAGGFETLALSCSGDGPLTYPNATAAHGNAGVTSPDGELEYAPQPGYAGPDTVSVTVIGADGQKITDRVAVTIKAPPLECTPTGTAIVQPLAAKLSVACSGSVPLTYAVTTPPAGGSVVVDLNGEATYTPDPGYSGHDSFTVTVTDGYGQSTVELITVIVSKPPPPVCPTDTVVVRENQSTTVTPSCIGTGAMTYAVAQQPSHGTAAVVNGQVVYTPDSGYPGSDSFVVYVTDLWGQLGVDEAAVMVVPPAPSCSGDSATAAYEIATTVTLSCSGSDLQYAVKTAPGHGTLSQLSGGQVLYTPDSGYSGQDSFAITVEDPYGGQATDTVSVTVAAPPSGTTTLTPDPDDQLTSETAETQFSLQPSQTQTATVSCPSGEIATDGHPLIQAVDQGTGSAAQVDVLEERATGDSSGSYEFTLYDPLAGQVQGKLYASCVSSSTSKGHQLSLSSQQTQAVALSSGDTSTTLNCPSGTVAVAPGYQVQAGSGTPAEVALVESGPTAGGSSWAFVLDSDSAVTAQVSVSCLSASTADGSALAEFTASQNSTVDGSGTPASTALACPDDTVAVLGGYSVGPGARFVGEEPQARSLLMWLAGLPGEGDSATLSALCLGLTTSTVTTTTTTPTDGSSGSGDGGDGSDGGGTSGGDGAGGAGTSGGDGGSGGVTNEPAPPPPILHFDAAVATADTATFTATTGGALIGQLDLADAVTNLTIAGDVAASGRQSHRASRDTIVLRAVRHNLKAGGLRLALSLNATGRSLLAKRHSLRVALTITLARHGAKTTTLHRTITLRAAK